jgi:predicted DNA-binding protein with PD1-like motif
MADAKIVKEYDGSFEIVSLVGTMESGNSHLHISLSDKEGDVFGGHLKQGSIVGVTAEIVIGELENLEFTRTLDADTGYDELVVA